MGEPLAIPIDCRRDVMDFAGNLTRPANHLGCFAPVSSPFCKNILIFRSCKSVYTDRIPFHSEGRFANVTDVGWAAVDAGCASDEGAVLRTAKPCGPDASVPASSGRNFFASDGVNKPITGESTE